MISERFQAITDQYWRKKIAVIGDFCLDRYLEIDPSKQETSLETHLPVHNVVKVRSQPGGAGTILNNLVALGVGEIYPVGFCGDDGEGFELRKALRKQDRVKMDYFLKTDLRRTFTYCKPLRMEAGQPPVEHSRLDSKNWTPTPALVQGRMIDHCARVAADADALVLLDQVDLPETGVITPRLLEALACIVRELPELLILADSRRGLRGWPAVCFKMNAAELHALAGTKPDAGLEVIRDAALAVARQQGQPVFVTLSERGILAAAPDGKSAHAPARPTRGPIDIVGAGDAVTANLAASLACGATLQEALELAMAAASVVIHQLGTTGTASPAQIESLMRENKLLS
jgi:rfaE bifunctional protein kinase chain/domain